MCGVVAIFSPRRPVSRERLAAGTAALRHRGPDGQRTWLSPDHHVGLGHAQLSIVAPGGAQPIAGEDGQRHLVVNGEFYDHAAIRRRLEGRGHRFRTDTDSEIALHLYEDVGMGCLAHLRGEFAFVLWDGVTRTLFAARDRFGIKPLFYAQVGDSLWLASEAKALFAAGVAAAWDHEAVYEQLAGCFRADRSLFSGVRPIPPGHYLRATAGSTRLVRYWDVGYPPQSRSETVPEEERIAEVRRLLTEAVRLRLRAHVPVGYLLSGGLDSSAVLGLAAAHAGRPVRAFTVAFEGGAYDESAKARAAAAHVGADLDVVPVADDDLADHFAESVWYGEMIQVNAHGTARFLLSRAIQQAGYRAVMAGEGADELFAGYAFLRPALPGFDAHHEDNERDDYPSLHGAALRRMAGLGRVAKLFGPLTDAERQVARVSPLLARLSRAAGLPPGTVLQAGRAATLLRSILEPEFAAQFAGRDPYWDLLRRLDWRRTLWGREPAKQLLYLWLRSIFVTYHLAADRLDMAHAVEVRLPYLDHYLFEYASQIPVSLLAKGGRQKHLLREAARPYLREAVYQGAKQPFLAPPSALRPGSQLHALLQDTLRSRDMAALPFFDQQALQRLLDRAPALDRGAKTLLDPLLMAAVSLCLLRQQFAL